MSAEGYYYQGFASLPHPERVPGHPHLGESIYLTPLGSSVALKYAKTVSVRLAVLATNRYSDAPFC